MLRNISNFLTLKTQKLEKKSLNLSGNEGKFSEPDGKENVKSFTRFYKIDIFL